MREFSDLSTVFFASGASLMFRRSDIPQPFLDEYFLYHEDVYLSWLLRQRGFDVKMAQNSVVFHRGSASVRQQSSSLVTFFQERNRLLNCLLFYKGVTLLWLTPYLFADAVLKILLSILAARKSLKGILRSYFWFAVHAKWVARRRSEIQSSRKVPDREIMALMSSKVYDSDSTLAGAVNRASRWYAQLTGLAYHG